MDYNPYLKYFLIFVNVYINLRFFKYNIEAFALNLVPKTGNF